MKAVVYLEDGTVYYGNGFGKNGTSIGELVFNTSMTGYQEILTDPSYAGQVVTMTYPLIGNYGVNEKISESKKVHAKGFIAKNISRNPSNYTCQYDIDSMLKKMNVVGVYDIDTRKITRKIRTGGAMRCIISNDEFDLTKLKNILENTPEQHDQVDEVSTKKILHFDGCGKKVALIDFGVKNNIIENLKMRDCDVTVFPYNAKIDDIMCIKPDGVLLSNGPGDPKDVGDSINTVSKIIKLVPTFGICLGHQILALAVGGDTYKMKFGHRGGNHGVYDIEKDKAYITAQNHGYAVDADSIKDKDMIVTHINLNDNTVEGIRHKSLPVFSVQFHPEGAPGPIDSSYLFDKFIKLMNEK